MKSPKPEQHLLQAGTSRQRRHAKPIYRPTRLESFPERTQGEPEKIPIKRHVQARSQLNIIATSFPICSASIVGFKSFMSWKRFFSIVVVIMFTIGTIALGIKYHE